MNLVDELHIGGQSTFDVDLFVPKPRRLPGTPTRGGIGFCRSCFSCEAFFWLRTIDLVDELYIGGQSTFDVDLFVPKQLRWGNAGYRELLQGVALDFVGAASAAKLFSGCEQSTLLMNCKRLVKAVF